MVKDNLKFQPTLLNFGLPMGLLGLGVNAEHLAYLIGYDIALGLPFILLGWFSFIYLKLHYALGLLNGDMRVIIRNEWFNPFKRSFLPAVSLTGFLFIQTLSIYWQGITSYLLILTYIGLVLHIYVNVFLMSGWIFDRDVSLADHMPTWFILISSNFVGAITLMGLAPQSETSYEFSLFLISTGLFLWIVFATTLIYRLIFHTPLTTTLRPSLFIFLAPPSLACVATMLISDSFIQSGQVNVLSINLVSWFSYSFASIIFVLWLFNIRFFIESGLSMAGWSYVYPLAAYGLATQYMAKAQESYILLLVGCVLFILVSAIVVLLIVWHFKKVFSEIEDQAKE